jgi:ABC-type antimicrobial peptide transport system permease subunit
VAIVDERIARRLWPSGALGQPLVMGDPPRQQTFEVIGVVNPVRTMRVADEAMPAVFIAYPSVFGLEQWLVIKTPESAAALGPAIKHAVEALGTRRPVYDIVPMQTYIDRSIGDVRFSTFVLLGFAGAALLLTGVGLYGTLAYLISQRTPEFGVRMALGASSAQLVRMVGMEAAALTAVGAIAGIAGATAIAGTIARLLYEVTPFDAWTIAIVAGLLALIAIVAASGPAWRAARVDPCTALRAE